MSCEKNAVEPQRAGAHAEGDWDDPLQSAEENPAWGGVEGEQLEGMRQDGGWPGRTCGWRKCLPMEWDGPALTPSQVPLGYLGMPGSEAAGGLSVTLKSIHGAGPQGSDFWQGKLLLTGA